MRHHHKFAFGVYTTTVALGTLFGSLYSISEHISLSLGLYWAVQTITTVGFGDLPPKTVPGHYIAIATMVLCVAFWQLSFALITSWLVSFGLEDAKSEVKKHVTSMVGGADV